MMTYPCHLPESQSWNPARKLDHLRPQAWLQRSAGQNSSRDTVPDTSSDRSGSECNSKTGLLHGTHLSLPLRSMLQRGTACLQRHRAGAKGTMRRAAGRRGSLELTPALNSTPTSPRAWQPAPGAAQAFQAGAAAAGVGSGSQGCRGGWCGWCGCPGARGNCQFPAGLLKLQRGACGERRPPRPSAADGTQGLCSTARPRAGKAHHHGRSCWHALAEVDACTSWHHRAGGFLRAGSLVRSGR